MLDKDWEGFDRVSRWSHAGRGNRSVEKNPGVGLAVPQGQLSRLNQ